VRALSYDTLELHGLVRALSCVEDEEEEDWSDDDSDTDSDSDEEEEDYFSSSSSSPLIHTNASLRLRQSAEILAVSAEKCLAQIVTLRFRLTDLMKWIRGTAAQVRARNTAMDSIQRETARKRRVPDGVVRRVAEFLSSSTKSGVGAGLTECILGVSLSDHFTTETNLNQMPTLKSALHTTSHLTTALFDQPRTSLSKDVQTIAIDFESPPTNTVEGQKKSSALVAIHKRMGAETKKRVTKKEEGHYGCFSPKVMLHEQQNISSFQSKHWVLVARVIHSENNCGDIIQLTAISSGGRFNECKQSKKFHLTGGALLPKDCQVTEISFYGNDGSSTLSFSPGAGELVEEGKQMLCLLVDRVHKQDYDDSSGDLRIHESRQISEEIWMLEYDDFVFRPLNPDCRSKNINVPLIDENDVCCTKLIDLEYGGNGIDCDDADTVIHAKVRQLRTYERSEDENAGKKNNFDSDSSGVASRLVLSGSRGIGGVITNNIASTIDLFDLEENEEEDDESEYGEGEGSL